MCGSDCFEFGPPPDNILSMPPPPLPSYLLQRSAIVTLTGGNDSQPCFAAFMCEPSPGPREQGIELIELSGKGINDTWLLVLVSSCIGVILLGALLAILLIKCRDLCFSTYNYTYQETSIKQPQLSGMCGGGDSHNTPTKSHPFLSGTMLYPCSSSTTNNHNNQVLQQQLVQDNRMLWAALTPHGTTKHYVSESYPNQEDHYEVIDYENTNVVQETPTIKRTPKKSFDNSGFIGYDYEDPTPLIDSYHTDDLDSGYQEPHDIMATLTRCSPRPIVSSPTRIENPNIPPLNMHPYRNGTLNKKHTINRRISDTSSYGSPNI